jgi:hypothetical protein
MGWWFGRSPQTLTLFSNGGFLPKAAAPSPAKPGPGKNQRNGHSENL